MPKMTRLPHSDLSQLLSSYDLETSSLLRKLETSLRKEDISEERKEFMELMRDHLVSRIEFLLKYKRRHKFSRDWAQEKENLLTLRF